MYGAFNSKHFNYNPETKTFSAEASELGDFNKVIIMESAKTGRTVRFELSRVLRTDDEDQEVYGWEFKPADEAQYRDVADVRVLVWND